MKVSMEKFCLNHPSRKALSFCYNCGDYYCSDCLNEGKEFYYCKKQECNEKYLRENFSKDTEDSKMESNNNQIKQCPKCLESLLKSDKFCTKCGYKFQNPKRTVIYFIILLVIGVLIVIAAIKNNSPSKPDTIYNFSYEVTGTSGEYDVTILNEDGDTQQFASVSNGWTHNWTQTSNLTNFLYVSAQNKNSYGNVTVKIYCNGYTLKENTSYGGYTIATVSGKWDLE